jgi:hypothetical protein
MNECLIPTDGRRTVFDGQIFKVPSHLVPGDVYIKSPTHCVLTFGTTTHPGIVFRVSICAVDDKRASVAVSDALKHFKTATVNFQRPVTLRRELFR